MPEHKGGKKNRKWNRNKTFCTHYALRGQREKNKLRKITRHLKNIPVMSRRPRRSII